MFNPKATKEGKVDTHAILTPSAENDKYFDGLAVSSRGRVELHVERRIRVPR